MSDSGGAVGILGSNQAGMRAHNERLVLTLLRRRGPTAKADLARTTGLSAQTVSVIIRKLEDADLLVRGEPQRGRVGQPSVPIGLAPEGAFFVGLKVGRRSTELVLTNFLGEVMERRSEHYSHPMPAQVIEFARQAIASVRRSLPPQLRSRIAGLGIALPFRLWDWAQSIDVGAAEMDAWRDADLQKELAALHDFPVYLANDATAACGAELSFGANDLPLDFLHFYVGFFIGGGVVLNGALHAGPSGNAGALGSMPVRTGSGEIRQLIDVASLARLESRVTGAPAQAAPVWQTPDDIPIDDKWVREAAGGIAWAIVSATAVLDFQAVLIDGWLPPALRGRLVDEVRSRIRTFNMAGLTPPDIREGSIGPDARVLGAAALPLSERFLVDPVQTQIPA